MGISTAHRNLEKQCISGILASLDGELQQAQHQLLPSALASQCLPRSRTRAWRRRAYVYELMVVYFMVLVCMKEPVVRATTLARAECMRCE